MSGRRTARAALDGTGDVHLHVVAHAQQQRHHDGGLTLGQARHHVHQVGLLDVHVGFPDVEAGAQFRDGGAKGVDLRGPPCVGRPMGAGDHDGAVHRG